MLTATQRDALGQHIRSEIEALKLDIGRMEELIQPVPPDNAVGRLSRMEAISEKSVNEATLRAARVRQTRLEQTLGLLDDDDFDHCAVCDNPIPFARLELVPESRLCITCAEAKDDH